MLRVWVAAVAALVLWGSGTVPAAPPVSEAVDPRGSPVAFGDPRFGGPRPDELRRLDLGGMSTFTARYLRNEGQTIVMYSRAGDGEFVPKHSAPSELRERFIPPGGVGRPTGEGATLGAGRVYDFERYEMTLSGNVYGCFVAASAAQDDVLVVNQCRTGPAVPDEAEVAAALGRLRVVQPVREPDALALRGGKRI
ncbi:hypothetical protein [Azospirillum sp. sgz301742]